MARIRFLWRSAAILNRRLIVIFSRQWAALRTAVPGVSFRAIRLLPAAVFTTPDPAAECAATREASWRGHEGMFLWNSVTYYSCIENGLLSLRDETGTAFGAINADETHHFGIELGLTVQITRQLTSSIAYTYQDFRFREHPVRGTNRLAGAPRHSLHAMANYSLPGNWSAKANVRQVISTLRSLRISQRVFAQCCLLPHRRGS